MVNLTKKDIEQVFDKKIGPLAKILKETTATLRQTTALLTHIVQDVDELKSDIKTVKSALNDHTATLDAIYKNTETAKIEKAAFQATIERHERWFEQIAEKLKLELER